METGNLYFVPESYFFLESTKYEEESFAYVSAAGRKPSGLGGGAGRRSMMLAPQVSLYIM